MLLLVSNFLSRIIMNRIQAGVDRTQRKEQEGLPRGKWTVDQTFILRNSLGKANEWNATMYINFVGFEKALHSVHRGSLWIIMRKYSIPNKLIQMVKALYEDFLCSEPLKTMRARILPLL